MARKVLTILVLHNCFKLTAALTTKLLRIGKIRKFQKQQNPLFKRALEASGKYQTA